MAVLLIAYFDFSRPDSGFTKVVVAAHDIEAGSAISETDIRIVAMPEEFVPKQAFETLEDVIDRISAGPILQSEILTETRFVGPSLAEHLTHNPHSAIVAVSPADQAIAQVLRAGDIVDILTSGSDGASARPLARGGRVVSRTDEDKDTVILVALPSGAAETVAATQLTNPITLTLSNK